MSRRPRQPIAAKVAMTNTTAAVTIFMVAGGHRYSGGKLPGCRRKRRRITKVPPEPAADLDRETSSRE